MVWKGLLSTFCKEVQKNVEVGEWYTLEQWLRRCLKYLGCHRHLFNPLDLL
jgi:hypothetical protein